MQVTISGHWEDLNFPSPVSMTAVSKIEAHTVCAVNAGLVPLNSSWVRRQRAHMLLSAWLSPQLQVCSEAESKTGRALESMPQVEWATDLWMLILVKGRQWRCAGCIQVSLLWYWKEMVCAIRLIESNWETKNRFFFFLPRIHRINTPGSNLACH